MRRGVNQDNVLGFKHIWTHKCWKVNPSTSRWFFHFGIWSFMVFQIFETKVNCKQCPNMAIFRLLKRSWRLDIKNQNTFNWIMQYTMPLKRFFHGLQLCNWKLCMQELRAYKVTRFVITWQILEFWRYLNEDFLALWCSPCC